LFGIWNPSLFVVINIVFQRQSTAEAVSLLFWQVAGEFSNNGELRK
jgi:hypothetical protein